jgi:hypothetical protein
MSETKLVWLDPHSARRGAERELDELTREGWRILSACAAGANGEEQFICWTLTRPLPKAADRDE